MSEIIIWCTLEGKYKNNILYQNKEILIIELCGNNKTSSNFIKSTQLVIRTNLKDKYKLVGKILKVFPKDDNKYIIVVEKNNTSAMFRTKNELCTHYNFAQLTGWSVQQGLTFHP